MILLWFLFAAVMGLISIYYLLKFGFQVVVLAVKLVFLPFVLLWKFNAWLQRMIWPEEEKA
jgi:hypothetical protein